MKILNIIGKNFRIISKSKLALVLLVIGPVLLMIIAGVGFSNEGPTNIATAVYLPVENLFTEDFIKELRLKSFIVKKTNFLDDCIDSVKLSKSSICIELEKEDVNFLEIEGVSKEEFEKSGIGFRVNLHSDFSQPRTVWGIIGKVNSVVETFSQRVRVASFLKVKEKFNDVDTSLESQLRKLDLIILELNGVRSNLNYIGALIPNGQERDLVIDNINKISFSVDSLYVIYPIPELALISSQINQVKTELGSGYSSLPESKNAIYVAESSVDHAINRLIDIRGKLDVIRTDNRNLQGVSWDYILHPIPTTYSAISGGDLQGSNTQLNFLDYLFPSLISFFVLFTSVSLSANLVIRERISEAYIRNVMSEAGKLTFIIGNFITVFLIVLAQSIILFFVAIPFLNFSPPKNYSFFLIILSLSIAVFILIGYFLASLSKSREAATIGTISVSLLLIIFSSLITPIESLPPLFKLIFSNSPLVLTESLFRRYLIFESSLYQSSALVFSLVICFVVLFFITYLTIIYMRRRELK